MQTRSASQTSIKVASGLVSLKHEPDFAQLLPDDAVDLTQQFLSQLGPRHHAVLSFLGSSWGRRIASGIEYLTVPGFAHYIGLRKRLFDDETRAAIAGGTKQVMVLGAGFDSLCVRLARRYPQVRFIEVDHPATQSVKRNAVAATGGTPANMRYISCNFAESILTDLLDQHTAWNRSLPCIVLAEGLLMYLDQNTVSQLVGDIGAHMATGSALLCSGIRTNRRGRPALGRWPRLGALSLHVVGEPILWHKTSAAAARLLQSHGLTIAREWDNQALRERYLTSAEPRDQRLADIEWIFLAKKRTNTV